MTVEAPEKRVGRTLVPSFAASVFASLLIVSLSEALRIPGADYHGAAGSLLFSSFHATWGAAAILWPLMLLQLAVTAALALRGALPGRRRLLAVVELAVLLGAVAVCHAKLVEYRPFAWHPPFIAFHLVAFGVLAVWSLRFPLPADATGSARPPGLLGRRIVPVAAVALFFVLHFSNYALYYDRYPTLHTSVLMTSYLLVQAGLLTLFFGLAQRTRRRVRLAVAPAILGILVIAFAALSHLPDAQPYRAGFLRFSVIGQEISRNAWAAGVASGMAGSGSHDPDGVRRFAEQSGLPPLPEEFNLQDHNILLVSIETFRADESSMNNPERDLTPNLLAYAQGGANWFTRAYVGSSYTLQSIASLLTMSYTSASGLDVYNPRWNGYLPEDVPTIVEHLEEAGYDTFWVPYAGGASEDGILDWAWPRFGKVTVQSGDEAVLDEAKRELTSRSDGGQRFFGWVFFPGPHSPFRAHFDDMPAKTDHDRYRQELRYIDGVVDRLLTHLEQTGLDRDTIVIIHGDHGEEFKEHGKSGHESLYSECSNVPLIVRIPGVAGQKSDAPTSVNYVFPWLFSRGGPYLQGVARSRMETMFGPVLEATDGAVVAELFGAFGTRSLMALADHHFHHDFASKHHELYDLRTDPGEQKNIFDPGDDLSRTFLDRFERYLEVRARNMNIRFADGTADQQESEEDRKARNRAIKKLRSAGEDALVAALRDDSDWRIQREAITILCGRGDLAEATIDEMIKTLVAENRELRKRITRDYGKMDPDALAGRLLEALRSGSPLGGLSYTYGGDKVRTMSEAAQALLRRMGRKALPAIIDALDSDDVALLRYASEVVGQFPAAARGAVPRLTELAGHRDREVRDNARESLALFGAREIP